MDTQITPPMNPWEWPEPLWRGMVEKARAGRSLRPTTWPNGAVCAVSLWASTAAISGRATPIIVNSLLGTESLVKPRRSGIRPRSAEEYSTGT